MHKTTARYQRPAHAIGTQGRCKQQRSRTVTAPPQRFVAVGDSQAPKPGTISLRLVGRRLRRGLCACVRHGTGLRLGRRRLRVRRLGRFVGGRSLGTGLGIALLGFSSAVAALASPGLDFPSAVEGLAPAGFDFPSAGAFASSPRVARAISSSTPRAPFHGLSTRPRRTSAPS